ncbi:unnamed protein product [Rhizopus stolonifer]
MSSQPNTPKPTATTSPVVSTQQEVVSDAHHYPPSPPLPLESQKYDGVTPIQARKSRKESYTDQCPSFGPVMYLQNVFSLDRHSCVDVRLYTKVDRGFFLADNDWTCYRRNYFQVSGSFSLEGIGVLYEGQEYPCYVKVSTGQLEEIDCFMLGVSAKLSDCDKGVPLVQHTPKRDKGPQITPLPKPIRPGGNLGFSAVGSGQTIATFERLQFKTATANNGKRRAAQQYYVVVMELLAKLKTGSVVTVATTTSSSMVVRGRSPGHYAETDSAIPRAPRTSSDMSNYYARPGGSYHPSDMFQPSEYIPYEYNYSSFPPPPPPPPPPQSSAPSTPHTIVPPSQQSQSTYFENHERHPEYPHQHQNYNESSRKDEAHPSPYYWQRSEETSTQENWNRFRMPSNNSTLTSANSNHSAMTPTAMTTSNSNMTTSHSNVTTNHSVMTPSHSAMSTNHSAMAPNHSTITLITRL